MENTDNSCLVCHEAIEVFAIGKCDHPICFKCSTRMRALCEQLYCPICRADLPEVFFLTSREKFLEMPARKFLLNRKLKIQFENENVRQKFEELLEHKCRICKDRYPEKSFKGLQDHMRRVHTMFYCDLCLALKIFSSERKCYNRQELAAHRRVGDKDDKSYKGHPLCQFCDERYLDKDELYKHLRKDHYFCHFCESLGSQDFFQEYTNLREHFGTDHYLCEEGECIDKQFENAFRSEIDLTAHRAAAHSRAHSKFQSRQERTLNIDINLVPRPTNRGRGVVSREDYAEASRDAGRRPNTARKNYSSKREKDDVDRAIQASLSTMTDEAVKKNEKKKTRETPAEPDKDKFVDDIDNFPCLGERAAATSSLAATTTATTTTDSASLANVFAMSHNMSVGRGNVGSVDDFPVLKKSASGNDLGNLQQPFNYSALKSAQLSAKSAKPVKNPLPKRTSPPNAPSNTRGVKDKRIFEDFPELPSGLRANRNFAGPATTWENIAPPTQSVPIASNVSVVREKPNDVPARPERYSKPQYSDSDFPSLGGGAASSGPSAPSKWFKSSKNTSNTKDTLKSSYEESPCGAQNSDFSIIDRYSPVNIPDTPERDKKSKSNKHDKKKKKPSNQKEQIRKENTKNSVNGNNCLDDIASLLMSSSSQVTAVDKVPRGQSGVPPAARAPGGPDKGSGAAMGPQQQSDKGARAAVGIEQQSDKGGRAAGGVDKGGRAKEDNIEKLLDEVHLHSQTQHTNTQHCGQPDAFNADQSVKVERVKFAVAPDDFPSLGAPKKASKKPPPPGFKPETSSQAQKVPPGLAGIAQTVNQKAPPGFVEPTTSIPKPEEVDSRSNYLGNFEYNQPSGFTARNKELIGLIQSYCDDPQAFTDFKKLSGEFRRSDIGAQLYFESCEDVLGRANFGNVFSELLALLPDIAKQQELLQVYIVKNSMKKEDDGVLNISKKSRSSKGAWTPTLSGFLTCQTCNQVLVRKDYNTHVTIHNMDSDFPSLADDSKAASCGLGTYGSAWVKAK